MPAIPLTPYLPVMRVNVGKASSAPRAFSLTYANPSLFLNFAETFVPSGGTAAQIYPMALNANGSTNSYANPAPLGSTISVFVNGVSPNPAVASGPVQFSTDYQDGWSIVSVTPVTPFELRVTVKLPSQLGSCASGVVCTGSVGLVLSDTTSYSVPQPVTIPSFGGMVYVTAPP